MLIYGSVGEKGVQTHQPPHSKEGEGARTPSLLKNLISLISLSIITKYMPRNPLPRPNKYNYPLDTPFKIIYVSAQAVENKFSKVRLLPQMSFYTSKILVFKR